MKIEKATREFRYNNIALADPGAQMDPQEVRTFYANVYPEIVNAEIDGPEAKGAKLVYTFRRAVGTKGGQGRANNAKRDWLAAYRLFRALRGIDAATCITRLALFSREWAGVMVRL